MGKNNKARRAAKAKARAKARARWSLGGSGRPDAGYEWDGPGPSAPQEPVFDDVTAAAFAWRMAAARRGERSGDEFVQRLLRMSRSTSCQAAESLFLEHLKAVWAGGWQPAELRRQGVIGCSSAAAGRLTTLVIAADHAARPARTLDSRWLAQVEGLGLPSVDGRSGWLAGWSRAEDLERSALVEVVLDALSNLLRLPALEPLIPPPGGAGAPPRAAAQRGARADPLLERIRNLLAKAESTTFEAEATALTAKAQELMTRHAVDAALLTGSTGPVHEPVVTRLPVDAPYADVKSLLLQTVAEAGRCRAVYLPAVAMSTVVGYGDDVAGVEMLFTSLLVQAQHALGEAARHAAPGTRTRSQSYRSAFLLAFSQRIGERLREINDAVLSDARSEHGDRFLPVLASMADSLDAVMAERYRNSYSAPVRGGYDAAGWSGGRFAADNARLSFGELADEA